MLNDLQLGEFIYEQPAVGDIEYIFKHALTQEVAYNSVLIERRKQLHERIGAALETLYASSLEDHLAELAHHYGRSANSGKAVQYLTRAGQQALERSAFAEAQAQLRQGLEWIKALPESPERDARELELASALVRCSRSREGTPRLRLARQPRAPVTWPRKAATSPAGSAGIPDLAWRLFSGKCLSAHRHRRPNTRSRRTRGQSHELRLRAPCSIECALLSRRPRRSRGAFHALEGLP